MNQNEYGPTIYFNAQYDMSANSALSLVFTKPDGTTLTVTPTLETGANTINGKTLAANKHVSWTTVDGNIDANDKGTWKAVLTATFASQRLTVTDRFVVGA